MTRVAILAQSDIAGGAEQYMCRLATGLTERGHYCVLFGSIPGWADTGLPSVDIGLGPKWSRKLGASGFLSDFRSLRRVHRALQDAIELHAIDFVNSHFKREQIALSRTASRTAKIVWTEHGSLYNGLFSSPLRAAYRAAARTTTTIVAASVAASADVKAWSPKAHVILVPNGVDTDFFRPPTLEERNAARSRTGLPQGHEVAAVVSRLDRSKRLDRVFRNAPMHLLVAGRGDDSERLKQLNSAKGTTFLGHVDRVQVRDVYWAADLVICSSSETGEGIPLSILEAAACGCLLVGFKGDPIESLVLDAGGLALDQPDLSSIGPSSPSVRARNFALRHSESEWLDRYEEIFADLQSPND